VAYLYHVRCHLPAPSVAIGRVVWHQPRGTNSESRCALWLVQLERRACCDTWRSVPSAYDAAIAIAFGMGISQLQGAEFSELAALCSSIFSCKGVALDIAFRVADVIGLSTRDRVYATVRGHRAI
jgi:hypothetical protein